METHECSECGQELFELKLGLFTCTNESCRLTGFLVLLDEV